MHVLGTKAMHHACGDIPSDSGSLSTRNISGPRTIVEKRFNINNI
jgi:hypothetical protein